MKRAIAVLLATISLMSCLVLSGCGESHENWHNRQVEKGMKEARKQLGR